jgi:hypothetical protein
LDGCTNYPFGCIPKECVTQILNVLNAVCRSYELEINKCPALGKVLEKIIVSLQIYAPSSIECDNLKCVTRYRDRAHIEALEAIRVARVLAAGSTVGGDGTEPAISLADARRILDGLSPGLRSDALKLLEAQGVQVVVEANHDTTPGDIPVVAPSRDVSEGMVRGGDSAEPVGDGGTRVVLGSYTAAEVSKGGDASPTAVASPAVGTPNSCRNKKARGDL